MNSVERCLGMDLGEKRIGLALSDPLGWTAAPLAALPRAGWKKEITALRSLVEAHAILRIVVGLPLRMSGEAGEQAQQASEFAARLQRALGVPVETWDERLTTVQAERTLIESDIRRERRRQVVDSLAASIILQGYLDYRNAGGAPR
jgi:putative Holliday junction resolvase